MARTLKFFLRGYSCYPLIYLAFGVLGVGGSWLSGSANNVFGTYVTILPMLGVIFGALYGTVGDPYLCMAISMGARRRHCFWAIECSLALLNLCAPLFSLVFGWLLVLAMSSGGLEDFVLLAENYTLKDWVDLYLLSMLLAQAGMIAGRLEKQLFKVLLLLAAIAFGTAVMVAQILFAETDLLAELEVPEALLRALPLGLAAGALLLGLIAYRQYRKAVVRA